MDVDRQQISFFIDRDNYKKIRMIASLKNVMRDRSEKGRAFSAAQLINEAIAEYIERNEDLLTIIQSFTNKQERPPHFCAILNRECDNYFGDYFDEDSAKGLCEHFRPALSDHQTEDGTYHFVSERHPNCIYHLCNSQEQ